ncbi:MAG: hypothetical protein WAV50_00295 [Minisyncoccia bacterium]
MNYQRGFIVPLLLIVIALVFAGGGAYVYTQKKSEVPSVAQNLPIAASTAQTSDSKTAGWKTYTATAPYNLQFKYPADFTVEVSNGMDGTGFQATVKNFAWQKDAYSFPFIKSLPTGKLYVQIWGYANENLLGTTLWLKTVKSGSNDPESVQVIGDYKNTRGTLLTEKTFMVNDEEAIQRTISYPGSTGSVVIVYTYLNVGHTIFQFINHNGDLSLEETYQKILSTFKFNP